MTFDTRSSGPRTFPPNASSVQTSSTVPGLIVRTGLTPPNVHANSEGFGRYARTSTSRSSAGNGGGRRWQRPGRPPGGDPGSGEGRGGEEGRFRGGPDPLK